MQQSAGACVLAQAEKQGSKIGRCMLSSGYGYTPSPGLLGGLVCRFQGHQPATLETVALVSRGIGNDELEPKSASTVEPTAPSRELVPMQIGFVRFGGISSSVELPEILKSA